MIRFRNQISLRFSLLLFKIHGFTLIKVVLASNEICHLSQRSSLGTVNILQIIFERWSKFNGAFIRDIRLKFRAVWFQIVSKKATAFNEYIGQIDTNDSAYLKRIIQRNAEITLIL